uniref:Short-chain dehydrogenase/reductase family 42E member 1 isoform X2 n=1 Tax=Geotrypetes seraphini TaxID=260995 RepID=A0A6P8RC17_GEOSA|nr:short-chain dehydrogenase/reductase family 42E member 1 isoform X2 [Geotrypetes seraphini]XP_033797339.1 short-chain dehydrogenase/reductase family 42E member 1 isoform X2 [Geotrypetes seraphini]XP_033797340.1 short-chain dehydrogenase/reductase family 42E member 1 isoform X2 [Geotrypetes seraphini]XP_033797341.1 short-chain dehydrogenase/reductase family 42E member 1 isoform X2 [Geotrypetes seraphini]
MICEQLTKETVLITGGSGYFGYRLGCALHKKGVNVILFDVRKPAHDVPEGVKFMAGDVRCLSDIEKALNNVSCVFHSASYGMSGKEQLNRRLIEDVNVNGAENVIQACQRQGVPSLVYTSTCNVVFGGQIIKNGDESLPYLPLHLHPDHYSRTKSLAEMKVLEANGSTLEKGKGALSTCALRPAGIYGPGEQKHLPRIVNYIESGLFKFVYGDPDSLVQFVHVDNLVSAHILASEALKPDRRCIAAGQSYFISDGKPVNNFEFFRPLVESLGYRFPTIRLPISFVYFFAFLTEQIHFLVGRIYNFQPLLTRTEVYKTGVTHYFSTEKAKRELGYEAQQFNLGEVIDWFKSQGHGRKLRDLLWRLNGWDLASLIASAAGQLKDDPSPLGYLPGSFLTCPVSRKAMETYDNGKQEKKEGAGTPATSQFCSISYYTKN